MTRGTLRAHLVDNLAMEGHTHGTKEQACILVRLGAGVDGDVATRDHLRRVPIGTALDPTKPEGDNA